MTAVQPYIPSPTAPSSALRPQTRGAAPRVQTPARAARAAETDRVAISPAARERLAAEKKVETRAGPKDEKELSADEKQKVAELKQRDQEVRAHEQAHLSALGGEGGSASFKYQTGPDGRRYAVEGEVPVSIGEVPGDTQATIEKARRVARAATAPAQPSAADQRARARAQQVEAEARQKLAEEQKTEKEGGKESAEIGTTKSAETAALGLIDSIKPASDSSGPCGVCHPDQQGKSAPLISVTIEGQ